MAKFSASLIFAIALALTALIFWPAIDGPFVFDDIPNLSNLRELNQGIDRQTVGAYLYSFPGVLGRPLAAISFLIEDSAWPTEPEAFKRNNILFHLLTGVFVFVFLRTVSATATRAPSFVRDTAAALLASAWLLHPLQLSTLMLVVQRMTILSSLFIVIGLLLFARRLLSTERIDLRAALESIVYIGLFGLIAFLAKENGVLIFGYAAVMLATVFATRMDHASISARFVLWVGTAGIMILILGWLAVRLGTLTDGYATRDFTLIERLLTQPRVLIDYVVRIIFPSLSGAGVFHDDYPISRSIIAPLSTLPAILFWVLITGLSVKCRKLHPIPCAGALWFLAGHAIESTFVPLEMYFEHRNYLPMLGPFVSISWIVYKLLSSRSKLAAFSVAAWLAAAVPISFLSAEVWGDENILTATWKHENPDSVRATQMRAEYLYRTGDTATAVQLLRNASTFHSGKTEIAVQLLLVECIHNGFTRQQLMQLFRVAESARLSSAVLAALRAFRAEANSGACGGSFGAPEFHGLAQAMLTNPEVAARADIAAYIHYEIARQAIDERNLDRAMQHLDAAFKLQADPRIRQQQAVLLASAGLFDDALKLLDQDTRTEPASIKDFLLNLEVTNKRIRTAIKAAAENNAMQ